MTATETSAAAPGRAPVRRVFDFFFFLARRAKKTRVFVLLALFPIAVAVLVKAREVSLGATRGEMMAVFTDILMALYLQFLVVILAVFYGTSIASEETENRTLPFLTTRPVSKPAVVLGKYAAYTVLTSAIVLISLACAYFILNSRTLGQASTYTGFLRYAGVLALALAAYTAFFAFLGTVVRRSIFLGLIFGYGWETVISYFPGSTQKFSILHYLKSLLPVAPRGRFSFLTFRLEPTPDLQAILTLVLVIAVCLGLACLVFRWKEYLFED